MKKTFILLLLCCFPAAAFAQLLPKNAAKALAGGDKVLKPLSNAQVAEMVARGKEGLVLRRALGVSVQRNYPAASILKDGEVNRVLLQQAWRRAAVNKYRWEEGNMLGLNSWLMVLAHRVRESIKLSKPLLKLLEQELKKAQQEAETEFLKRYKYSQAAENFQNNPAFLSLLGESVAQRLESYVLPHFSSADRVRFLQLLMSGLFSGPVNWQELHTAFLYREIREALAACGQEIVYVEYYGSIKKAMRECAKQAAYEAENQHITSVVKLRDLFIENMKDFSDHFSANPAVEKDWNRLIDFFQQKQHFRSAQ